METGTNVVLANELGHGHELARELEARLNPASLEKSLAQEIIASLEKVISMAKSSDFIGGSTDSPHSENSGLTFKAERKVIVSKKRKAQPKWRKVKLGAGPEAEGPLDDGYNWRKYGQKEILGAKHPRGYYRCTHCKSQSCLAMKQVQRSDDNPSIFEVTYRGSHTCHRKSSRPLASSFSNLDCYNNPDLLNFQSNIQVKVQEPTHSAFSFPSTPIDGVKPENDIFSPSSTIDNSFKGSFTSAFFSPATSESNYFSTSPCRMSSYGEGANLQVSESDFTEIVSGATSASNSPMMDLDFLLPSSEWDPDFLFDTSSFFL